MLFHFSDRGDIGSFEPRPVQGPAIRKPGLEWLNGPLVWAIDDWHQPLYLFPRDCPRILMWRIEGSTSEDWTAWSGGSVARMIAFIERGSKQSVLEGSIYRYTLPRSGFEGLDDAGMHVCREKVVPSRVERITSLPAALQLRKVEWRVVQELASLRNAWDSTLQVSGLRLRNATTW